MKIVPVEQILNNLEGTEIYPITLVKYLLNRSRILTFFQNANNDKYPLKISYTIDNTNCEACKEKAAQGVLCRQHTSIDRVLKAKVVGYDTDLQIYIHMNEIFSMINGKLVIVYCPHTKLINGPITDSKVRKVNPITVIDPKLKALPEYTLMKFSSKKLLDQHLSCWFNNEFTLVTIPTNDAGQDFCLIPNKK